MKAMKLRKKLTLMMSTIIIGSVSMVAVGCGSDANTSSTAEIAEATEEVQSTVEEAAIVTDSTPAVGGVYGEAESNSSSGASEVTFLGEGDLRFIFTVEDVTGSVSVYDIQTDKETVGEALEELDLIAGDESEYGLYVTTVNGTTLDYDTDGKYWAFYINGEYASTGVDSTEVTEDATYTFRVEE